MNIIFIGNWSITDGLTQSTVFPHLKILSKLSSIDKIILCTIERSKKKNIDYCINIPKVIHTPIHSLTNNNCSISKILDYYSFRKQLLNIAKVSNSKLVICRGTPSGIYGYYIYKKIKIPFYVESFEPHADYMYESGVWGKFSLKFIMENYWENKLKIYAEKLFTVSHGYKDYLITNGCDSKKLDVIPCCVDLDKFNFNEDNRIVYRNILKINDEITGIYVGKFGGLYYNEEAYKIFKSAFDYFKYKFKLIILSPSNISDIKTQLLNYGINHQDFIVSSVPHDEVPLYLSASDFAFSLYKPSPSKKYLSPIKNGEYWANGLPIIMTKGIGDDDKIIDYNDCGATFDLKNNELIKSLMKIEVIINSGSRIKTSQKIKEIALKYRDFSISKNIYNKVYGTIHS